jgi:hypothetical protein
MANDQELEAAIDTAIARWRRFVKKRMFGGVGYMLRGNMCFGVHKANLIIRCGAKTYEQQLLKPGVRKFDITGRPMTGWVMLPKVEIGDDDDLKEWLTLAKKFVTTLPPK